MPLSDHEARLLEQMEQQLLSDDPRFATTMRGPRRPGRGRNRLAVGTAVVVLGLALLVVSVVPLRQVWVGVLAFVLMLAGILFALSAPSRSGPVGVVREGGGATRAQPGRPGRAPRSGTFMQRLEQRWDRRRDDRWG